MTNKKFIWGILVLALVFGTVLLGCPTEPEEEKDTWSDVTSLNQLDGTWKGTYSETQTIKEYMEGQGATWDDTAAAAAGDIKVTNSMEMTMTINASAKTQATSIKMTMAFSGGNIDTLWKSLKPTKEIEGVTVDDSKHSMTMTQNSPAETMTDEEIADMLEQGLQINQKGTKLKSSADSDSGTSEIIFTKQ
jgi:hypothetical protein